MSNINKTGFYIIDKNHKNEININENIYVSLFVKNLENNLIINIKENSKVDFYGFFSINSPKKITINQLNNNSKLNFKTIFFNKNDDLISNIISNINSFNSNSNIEIISIVKEHKISIDSSIIVDKNSKNINASLNLENIFIGNSGTINSIPNLFIDSNDVKVSHSSKSHRIDENKLFYLKSRGLNEENSIKLMTHSYFQKTFSCLKMIDKNIFENINNEFLNLN